MLKRPVSYRALMSGTDQVLAMLSNVLVAVFVARVGGAQTLGAYSYAFAVYLIVLGLARALVSEPFLTHEPDIEGSTPSTPRSGERGLAAAVTSTILLAGLASALVAIWGLVSDRAELQSLAIFLLALLVQDLLRYAFFRWGRPLGAVILDGVWVVFSGVAVLLGFVSQPAVAVAAWATGALAGAAWGMVHLRVQLAPLREAATWWTVHARRLGSWLTLDSVVFVVTSQLSVLIVTAFASDALLGSIRAVQILIGPLALILTTLNMFLLPQFAQRVVKMTVTEAARVSAFAGLLTGAGLLMLLAAREPIAHILFGGQLSLQTDVLVPLSVQQLAVAASVGAGMYIRSRRRGRELFSARLLASLLSIPLVIIAASRSSASLLAWTLAVQGAVFTLVAFGYCRVVARNEARATELPSPDAAR